MQREKTNCTRDLFVFDKKFLVFRSFNSNTIKIGYSNDKLEEYLCVLILLKKYYIFIYFKYIFCSSIFNSNYAMKKA